MLRSASDKYTALQFKYPSTLMFIMHIVVCILLSKTLFTLLMSLYLVFYSVKQCLARIFPLMFQIQWAYFGFPSLYLYEHLNLRSNYLSIGNCTLAMPYADTTSS